MTLTEFDQSLKKLAARPIPGVPGNLAASVRREIRLRGEVKAPRAETLANWLWRRHVAFASIPTAAVMGMVIALLLPAQEGQSAVSQALYLNVFSQDSPTLPSTYIALGR